MKDTTYLRAGSVDEAVAAVSGDPQAAYLGGGTNLVDHLKLGLTTPGHLVDISRLPLDEVETVDDEQGLRLRVGANVRNSDLAAHPLVRRLLPAVSRALLAGASGQIRNQATTGGNLLQRTRCVYFQDVTTACNKRDPGSGCSALEGYGRYNAILGASPECVATHPSDLAVALTALDAVVEVQGADGVRRTPIGELLTLPGHQPERDSTLMHGELITALEIPVTDLAAASTYYKARDRASYAFALVSVAAAVTLEDDVVSDIALAWGGAAHRPWRATRAEEALRGRPLSEAAVREAVAIELTDAVTTEQTDYKRPMLAGSTVLALGRLAPEAAR